jgi:hypothetical protein
MHEAACPAFGRKVIILDDLCTDEPLTEEQQERLKAWFVDAIVSSVLRRNT